MALSTTHTAEVRRSFHGGGSVTGSFTKAEITTAIAALDAYFEATCRAGFGSAIETAAPGKFTVQQKKRLVAFYLRLKCASEGF